MQNGPQLDAERCPHCGIAKPFLSRVWGTGNRKGNWDLYCCRSCDGMVLTRADTVPLYVSSMWPSTPSISETIPERAREFLRQATASLHTPAGAMMLTASAVDAMLKDKGYKTGVLNTRIKAAADAHLITNEMAEWAHEIRLDANEQRHADEEAPLPNQADAERSLEFSRALGQFLYVLPAMVAAGRRAKTVTPSLNHSPVAAKDKAKISFPGG